MAPFGTSGAAVPSEAQSHAALVAPPAEVSDALQDVADVAGELRAQGANANAMALLAQFGTARADKWLHDTQTIQDWYRHNCGPDSASSPWCDAVATSLFDQTRTLTLLQLSSQSNDVDAAANAASVALLTAIEPLAPASVQPSIHARLAAYQANGGKTPTDTATNSARDAIVSTVQAQCAIAVSPSEV
jgi:hypothetical protein